MATPSPEERVYFAETLPLERDARVEYVENLLDQKEADALFQWCMKNLQFADHKVRVYGKELLQPRKTCAVGTGHYSYSGLTINGTPMPKEFEPIIDQIVAFLPDGHARPNTVLCNLYETGDRYISQHSDTEKDLVPGSCIVGLSLGAVRHFDLVAKEKRADGSTEKHRVDLAHGSIIIMGKGCQTHYKHGVPIQKTIREPRINLTFRVVKNPM